MNKALAHSRLLELLLRADFDKRYYSYCERHGNGRWTAGSWLEPAQEVLAATHLSFRYVKKEHFFYHRETFPGWELKLHVSLKGGMADWGLYIMVGELVEGGVLTVLAREVGTLRDPGFTPAPPAPRAYFSNAEQMKIVVAEGVALFEHIKKPIVSCDWKALAQTSGGNV